MPEVLPKNCKKKQCYFAGKDASPCLSYLFLGGSKNYRSSTEGCQILKLHAPLYDTNPNFMHYFCGKALTFTIDFCINFDLFQKWVAFLASMASKPLPWDVGKFMAPYNSPPNLGVAIAIYWVRKSPESWHLSITTDTATLSCGMEAKGRPPSYLGPCRKSWPSLKPTYCWWTQSGVHQLIW